MPTSAPAVATATPCFTKYQTIRGPDQLGEEENVSKECKELLVSLPREKGWRTPYLYKFQGFWCQPKQIEAIMSFQKHFKSRDDDLILATIPKSGTTWLKALAFAVLNRKRFLSSNNHPLLTHNPHDLVPFFEYKLYANNQVPDLSVLPSPRLFATHIPFSSLNIEAIKKSHTRVVYLCRNPFDTFVSSWHYINELRPQSLPPFLLEEAFEMYCKGAIGYGPFWEHMLGYWNESQERPEKVLFLKYEDLKEDIILQLKRLANFLGFPFSMEEERQGVIQEIAKLCSFENLKNLEVNKSGESILNFKNKYLFRKGVVGDSMNYLSPSMVEKLSQIKEERLGGSGLTFKLS